MSLRKRLAYHSWHRGTRENDLILGRFADAHLETMSDSELSAYETLLDQTDAQLYDWIVRRLSNYPENLAPMIHRIQHFYD